MPRCCVLLSRSYLVHKMPLGDLFLEQYDFADVFNRLNLSDSEVGLVCAIMLINSGLQF
jgi:hypothetical protein